MSKEPWELQHERKYRDHDFIEEDLTEFALQTIREIAVKEFVGTRESDNVKLSICAFMGYLTSKGFRITKEGE